MILELAPHSLAWADVDPARHPFDSASAPRVVRSLGPAQRMPSRPGVRHGAPAMREWSRSEGRPWAEAMALALADHYGRWTVGWRWTHDEGDFNGGPVGSWCCPEHSITTSEETIARVADALCEWRAWLESLAGRFEAYPLSLAEVEDQRILWERAARNLILQVTDRTFCGSGWYRHCRQVLTWFLSRWGVAPALATELVDDAIGGRFETWTDPGEVLIDDVAERLALSLQPPVDGDGDNDARSTGSAPDHLERWLAVRETVAWQEAPDGGGDGPVTPPRDGAAEDIRTFDGAVDPARARGLLAALELLRTEAARGASLDFELLQRWQQLVLGTPQPPPFRDVPAFAKVGRERYGIAPDTRARLDTCLAESVNDSRRPRIPLTARAARAYLDVCFFHPFDDGNARSAFLALVYVLAREGVALDEVGLLRPVTFQADEPADAMLLASYIDVHLVETRRRAAVPGSRSAS